MEEVDFAEEFGRDRGGFPAAGAAADPDDVGRVFAFSLALDEDGTGALDNLGGW